MARSCHAKIPKSQSNFRMKLNKFLKKIPKVRVFRKFSILFFSMSFQVFIFFVLQQSFIIFLFCFVYWWIRFYDAIFFWILSFGYTLTPAQAIRSICSRSKQIKERWIDSRERCRIFFQHSALFMFDLQFNPSTIFLSSFLRFC